MAPDTAIALLLGFFVGVVVCVKLVSWLVVKASGILMRWIMDHM